MEQEQKQNLTINLIPQEENLSKIQNTNIKSALKDQKILSKNSNEKITLNYEMITNEKINETIENNFRRVSKKNFSTDKINNEINPNLKSKIDQQIKPKSSLKQVNELQRFVSNSSADVGNPGVTPFIRRPHHLISNSSLENLKLPESILNFRGISTDNDSSVTESPKTIPLKAENSGLSSDEYHYLKVEHKNSYANLLYKPTKEESPTKGLLRKNVKSPSILTTYGINDLPKDANKLTRITYSNDRIDEESEFNQDFANDLDKNNNKQNLKNSIYNKLDNHVQSTILKHQNEKEEPRPIVNADNENNFGIITLNSMNPNNHNKGTNFLKNMMQKKSEENNNQEKMSDNHLNVPRQNVKKLSASNISLKSVRTQSITNTNNQSYFDNASNRSGRKSMEAETDRGTHKFNDSVYQHKTNRERGMSEKAVVDPQDEEIENNRKMGDLHKKGRQATSNIRKFSKYSPMVIGDRMTEMKKEN